MKSQTQREFGASVVVSMATIISTNLTKKQRIRNLSSPLRDNLTSMDCWSSDNPLTRVRDLRFGDEMHESE